MYERAAHDLDDWDVCCQEYDLRQIQEYLRQIESTNSHAAIERASREIQHDNYRLERLLKECGLLTD